MLYRRVRYISPWAYTRVRIFWWAYTRSGLIFGGHSYACLTSIPKINIRFPNSQLRNSETFHSQYSKFECLHRLRTQFSLIGGLWNIDPFCPRPLHEPLKPKMDWNHFGFPGFKRYWKYSANFLVILIASIGSKFIFLSNLMKKGDN